MHSISRPSAALGDPLLSRQALMAFAVASIKGAADRGDTHALDSLVRDFARFIGRAGPSEAELDPFYRGVLLVALRASRFAALLDLATAYAEARQGDTAAWSSLIRLRRAVGDVDGARRLAERLTARPNLTPREQWMVAREAHSVLGDLAGEMRGLKANFPPASAHFPSPWRGEPLEGKQLLVLGDNGLGDQIQMFRFLPAVVERSRGARVVLVCHPSLCRLPRTAGWPWEIVGRDSPEFRTVVQTTRFDYHLSTDLCPEIDGTTLTTLPPAPYLDIERGAEPPILRGLARPRVGLVWAGGQSNPTDHFRSLPLPMVERLVSSTRDVVSWVSCQVGPSQAWLGSSEILRGLPDVGATVSDMTDTARAFLHLDLVVSVDSSPAHVAGAIGVPVWMLLGALADPRWLLSGEETPWYGSMRLIREGEQGDWAPAIERVSGDLRRWAEDLSTGSSSERPLEQGAVRPRSRRPRRSQTRN